MDRAHDEGLRIHQFNASDLLELSRFVEDEELLHSKRMVDRSFDRGGGLLTTRARTLPPNALSKVEARADFGRLESLGIHIGHVF